MNYLLYYNTNTGAGAIGQIDELGNHTMLKSYPEGASLTGWTHIAATKAHLLYYNTNTGAGAIGQVDELGSSVTLKSYPEGSFSTGWTHIAATHNHFLTYNISTGAGGTGRIDESGNFITLKSYAEGSFSTWTHIAATKDRFLYYNTSTGAGAIGQVDELGSSVTLKSYPEGSFSTGWTHIAATKDHFLAYNANTGAGGTGQIDAVGNYIHLKGYDTGSFSTGWTHIAATHDHFLTYNINTGAGGTGRIDESGNFITLKSYPDVSFSTGWTNITAASLLQVQTPMSGKQDTSAPQLSPNTKIAAVSRMPNTMEMWGISVDGSLQGIVWYEGDKWRRYTLPLEPHQKPSINGGIAAVSRKPDTMELWWIGIHGDIWGAVWYENDQWRIYQLQGKASVNGGIAAISRKQDTMEVWWIGPNGSVENAHWYEGSSWNYSRIAGENKAALTSRIAAVSRRPDTIELWWIGPRGNVEDRYWYEGFGTTGWKGFELAPQQQASTTGSITAVSRKPGTIEIWWVGANGSVEGAYWYEGKTWQRYQLAGRDRVPLNGCITAISRKPETLELWWIDPQGNVQDRYWYEGLTTGWKGFELAQKASVGSAIAALSRIPEGLEIWWAGPDGSLHDAHWYEGFQNGWKRFIMPGSDICVEVLLHQLICDQISRETGIDNDRDEVYILVQSSTPKGLGGAHLPRREGNDDYYEFNERNKTTARATSLGDWTNQDQVPVGPPRIWHGVLKPGQSADFAVVIAEQDNKNIGPIKKVAKDALEVIGPLLPKDNKYVQAAYAGAKFLVSQLPDINDHDVIGSFSIRVTNDADTGKIQFVVLPFGQMQFPNGESVHTRATKDGAYAQTLISEGTAAVELDMNGTGGAKYRAIVAANVTLLPRNALRYVGHTFDQCSHDELIVHGKDGDVLLRKGQAAEIRVADREFFWNCGGTSERARGPEGTSVIISQRDLNSRKITWSCFTEEEF